MSCVLLELIRPRVSSSIQTAQQARESEGVQCYCDAVDGGRAFETTPKVSNSTRRGGVVCLENPSRAKGIC